MLSGCQDLSTISSEIKNMYAPFYLLPVLHMQTLISANLNVKKQPHCTDTLLSCNIKCVNGYSILGAIYEYNDLMMSAML